MVWYTCVLLNDYHNKVSYTSSHIVHTYNVCVCVCVCVREREREKTFKIHSLSNFQIYNTVLLTVVTMLYITSPGLIHLITGCLYPLTVFTCLPYLPPLCIISYNFMWIYNHTKIKSLIKNNIMFTWTIHIIKSKSGNNMASYRTGISKLWPAGQVWPTACVCK